MPVRPLSPLSVERLEPREVPAAPFETLPVFPSDPAALDHARVIFALGQELGRRPDVFMKVGDSNTDYVLADNGYLRPLGQPNYDPVANGLAAYGPNILTTWATFRSPVAGGNSYTRSSLTAYPGYSLPDVLPRLDAEIATTDGAVALVMLGTNDITVYADPAVFRVYLDQLVTRLEDAGIVPILSTIPENFLYNGARFGPTRAFNQVIADTAADHRVPLWNLFEELAPLPNEGVETGGLHLSNYGPANGNLTPAGLGLGQNVHNLGALFVLDWYRQFVAGGPPPAPVSPAWQPLKPGQAVYAVGRGVGQQAAVSVYDAATGQDLDDFLAYEPSFAGGVQVAVADVNGDGVPDIVTGAGSGGGPVVKVFSGTDGSLLGTVLAFEPSFRGGVNVAAADLDGDGKAEVVVGAGVGGGPVVAVYHGGDLRELERLAVYETSFRGGVNVAAATLSGFGPAVVVGSGVGGGPVVKVFRPGELTPAAVYLAYDPAVRTGVSVAAGDLSATGAGEIVTAPMTGVPHVRLLDPTTGAERRSFFAPLGSVGGARVAVAGGKLLVGNGDGAGVSVQVYSDPLGGPDFAAPNDPARAYGVSVG